MTIPQFTSKSGARKGCRHFALLFLVIAAMLLIQAFRSGGSAPTQYLSTVYRDVVASAADGEDPTDATKGDAEFDRVQAAVRSPVSTAGDVTDDSPEYNGTMPVRCMDFPPSLKNAHVSPKPSPEELDKWYGNDMRPFTSELDYWEYTIPFLNVTTLAKDPPTPFHSGYHNQMMGFTAFFMKVAAAGHDQVLLRTMRHADLFGHKPGIFFQGKKEKSEPKAF